MFCDLSFSLLDPQEQQRRPDDSGSVDGISPDKKEGVGKRGVLRDDGDDVGEKWRCRAFLFSPTEQIILMRYHVLHHHGETMYSVNEYVLLYSVFCCFRTHHVHFASIHRVIMRYR